MDIYESKVRGRFNNNVYAIISTEWLPSVCKSSPWSVIATVTTKNPSTSSTEDYKKSKGCLESTPISYKHTFYRSKYLKCSNNLHACGIDSWHLQPLLDYDLTPNPLICARFIWSDGATDQKLKSRNDQKLWTYWRWMLSGPCKQSSIHQSCSCQTKTKRCRFMLNNKSSRLWHINWVSRVANGQIHRLLRTL